MKTIGFGLMFVALAIGSVAQGCAKAADTSGSSDGEGGFGGGGVGGGVADGPGATTGSAGGNPATTGVGGAAAATTGAGSASTTTSTSATSTSAGTTSAVSATASVGSGMGCPAGQHLCGGICAGNTIQTGCFGSSDCLPCGPAPVNGTTVCSGNGTCDFTCGANYVKQGNTCACAASCCSDADCGGNGATCSGGSCVVAPPPPPSCDSATCTSGCFAACFFQMKVGVGTCINGACVCACL
ncbi:MAG: hypothetical protein ABJE95_06920 [Byssovorax sp.]